jgi:hypothetical protein
MSTSTRHDFRSRQCPIGPSAFWPVPEQAAHAILPVPRHVGHGASNASTPSATGVYDPIPAHVLQVTPPDPLHLSQVSDMPEILRPNAADDAGRSMMVW